MPRGAIMSLSRPRATRTLTAHRRWLSSGSTPLGTADNMQSFPASASSAVPPTAPPQTLSLDATAPPDHWRIAAVPTHTFDTMQFIQRLEQAGFTRTQSETILSSLQEVIDASMEDLQRTMVSRAHQDKTVHSYRLDFAHLKSDIQLLEKNDFALLKQENERIAGEVEKLKSKMREDLQRFQAGVRLDMNLDKGRVRDEQSVLQLQIKEAVRRGGVFSCVFLPIILSNLFILITLQTGRKIGARIRPAAVID